MGLNMKCFQNSGGWPAYKVCFHFIFFNTFHPLQTITLGFFYGLWDSIKGMTLVFYIDAEIHRQNAEKEAERQQILLEKQRKIRRSPSPVPSSASAMYEQELLRERAAMQKQNSDERSLDSLRKKEKPAEPSIPFK